MNPYLLIINAIQHYFALVAQVYPALLPALHQVYDPIIAVLTHLAGGIDLPTDPPPPVSMGF